MPAQHLLRTVIAEQAPQRQRCTQVQQGKNCGLQQDGNQGGYIFIDDWVDNRSTVTYPINFSLSKYAIILSPAYGAAPVGMTADSQIGFTAERTGREGAFWVAFGC